ncbi:MAG: AI-2E family transporter [Armatimonadetes bacterium]|nr:AI-2E family transporter [Armatimonadota bacterium]
MQTRRIDTWFELIWGLLFRLALIGLSVYALYRLRYVLVTVLLSVILALTLAPVIYRVSALTVPRVSLRARRMISALLVFFTFFSLVAIALIYIFQPFQKELESLLRNLDHYRDNLKVTMQGFQTWYKTLPPDVQEFLNSQWQALSAQDIMGSLWDWIRGMVGASFVWVSHIVDIILIPVLAYYFVLGSHHLKHEFLALVPARQVRAAVQLIRETNVIMRNYIVGQIWLCLIAGVLVGAVLWLLGVQYTLTLAILAAVTRAIPIIGPIIGGIPIVLLATAQSFAQGLAVLIFFTILHLVESKVIMPKIIGEKMHLHPAVVIIVLLIGAEFFGLLGMFLAAPIAAIIKVVLRFYVIQPRKAAAAGEPLSRVRRMRL